MGVQDHIHVISEEQEDEWICQEIFHKVKLHVEENKSDVFTAATTPISFQLDVAANSKNLKPKQPKSPSTSPRRVRKVCRKCPYANCCQSYVNVRRKRSHSNRKPASIATSPETQQQMETFVDKLLAEMDCGNNDASDLSDSSSSSSSSDEEVKTLDDFRKRPHGKLTRSISCEESRSPIKTPSLYRRWSLTSSRSTSPILKKNAVSWAYEGHSVF